MEIVGTVTVIVLAGGVIAGVAAFLMNLPDLARYRRLKRM